MHFCVSGTCYCFRSKEQQKSVKTTYISEHPHGHGFSHYKLASSGYGDPATRARVCNKPGIEGREARVYQIPM